MVSAGHFATDATCAQARSMTRMSSGDMPSEFWFRTTRRVRMALRISISSSSPRGTQSARYRAARQVAGRPAGAPEIAWAPIPVLNPSAPSSSASWPWSPARRRHGRPPSVLRDHRKRSNRRTARAAGAAGEPCLLVRGQSRRGAWLKREGPPNQPAAPLRRTRRRVWWREGRGALWRLCTVPAAALSA